MKITWHYDPRYGKHRFLPDCQLSKCLCKLANRRTLDPSKLALLETHGFDIILKSAPNYILDPNSFTGEKIQHAKR